MQMQKVTISHEKIELPANEYIKLNKGALGILEL